MAKIDKPRLWQLPMWLFIAPMRVRQSLIDRLAQLDLRLNRIAIRDADELETFLQAMEEAAGKLDAMRSTDPLSVDGDVELSFPGRRP
jgi:hypothetical protein